MQPPLGYWLGIPIMRPPPHAQGVKPASAATTGSAATTTTTLPKPTTLTKFVVINATNSKPATAATATATVDIYLHTYSTTIAASITDTNATTRKPV